jgi:hypothetical protein
MSDEQVRVREGVWLARDGERIEVRARRDGVETEFPWGGLLFGVPHKWRNDGRLSGERDHHCDLVEYVRPLPGAEAAPEPQPVEIREGVWRTRDGRQMQVRENTDWGLPSHPWVAEFDGEQYIWMRDGRYHAEADSPADLVAYLRPLPKAETTTETLVEIEQQAAEDLQQWMEATALQRRRLEAELSETTAARDNLQQQLATMTYERDNLAQRLWTKPSEEALQKQNAKQQIEINTLKDRLQDMTTDRDRLQARVRDLEIEIDAAGQQPAPADRSEQIERIWDESRERAVSEIIELITPLQVATGTHAESVLQILPAVIRRWMDGGPDDVE